jgi:hypothetical protein
MTEGDTLAGARSVETLAFAPDNRTAVSSSKDGVRLWDLTSRRELAFIRPQGDDVSSVDVGPSGLAVVIVRSSARIEYWDFERGGKYSELRREAESAVASLARKPSDLKAVLVVGKWYAFNGAWDWAAKALETAREGGEVVPSVLLGECYERLGDRESARREFRAGLREKTEPAYFTRLRLGILDGGNLSIIESGQGVLPAGNIGQCSIGMRALNSGH